MWGEYVREHGMWVLHGARDVQELGGCVNVRVSGRCRGHLRHGVLHTRGKLICMFEKIRVGTRLVFGN